MIFKFIHKLARKNYKNEIEEFIDQISSLNPKHLSEMFIYSVWTRAGLQNEGHFVFPDGTLNLSPNLSAYPIMIKQFKRPIAFLRKRGRNAEVAFLSIWVHTLRCLLDPELKSELDKLWSNLMPTKPHWDHYLNKFYDDDVKSGTDTTLLDKTLALSKEILKLMSPRDPDDM